MSKDILTNAKYWETRAIRAITKGEKTAIEMLKDLKRVFTATEKEIEKEIQAFVTRYKLEIGKPDFSMAELRRYLNMDEFKSAMIDRARYYDEVERLGGYSPEYKAYLRRLSARSNLSRLEELQLQTRHRVESLYREIHGQFTGNLGNVYSDTYYRTMYDLQHGMGIFNSFTAMNQTVINRAISERWLGENYSDRIWAHKDRLIEVLNTTFLRGAALGKNPNVIGRQMAKDVMDSYDRTIVRNCVKLAHTEFMHMASQSTLAAYREYGVVKEYQFLATLDERTCDICGPLDLEHWPLEDAVTGVNFPPLHARCRCGTVAYFPPDEIDKLIEKGLRIARDPVTGQNYYIPRDMTYTQWRESLTEEQGRHVIAKQAAHSQYNADKEQFARYKEYARMAKKEYGAEVTGDLFDGFPTKFADFQEMKYLRPDEWEVYKENRAGLQLTVSHADDTIGLPKVLRLPDETLKATANVNFPEVHGIVPRGSTLTDVRLIAGNGVSTKLRDAKNLSAQYGGIETDWQKKAGLVYTDNFRYDVHWYEYNGDVPGEYVKTVGVKSL